MAATISHIGNGSAGDQRYTKYKVTFGASSATADLPTNLQKVAYAIVNCLEGSAMPSMRFNSGVAGTATAGNIAFSSGTSAGSYVIVAYGPRHVG